MEIRLDLNNTYPVSDKLIGIFLEDIGFAVDGGMNANQINNYSFDGVYMDKKTFKPVEDPLRYWEFSGKSFESGIIMPLSVNSRYAVIDAEEKAELVNYGYSGGQHGNRCALSIKEGHDYIFSAFIRNSSFEGKIFVSVVNENGKPLTEKAELSDFSNTWEKVSVTLKGSEKEYGKLVISFAGNGKIDMDCLEFYDSDCWNKEDPKYRHGHFRKDLVETLQALKPAFMRFPGGCIVEGTVRGNEYNWKETVGELYERKSKYNLWAEKLPDGGYNQSYQIGFYEYLCLCEDLHMLPLPTLSAGLNCQIRARQNHLKDVHVDVESDMFQEYIVNNYLDLIDFCNGDPEQNKWAALRRDMGHPEPFELKMIGVGNENTGEDYEKRFNIIYRAIKQKDPNIKCVRCAGFLPQKAALWKHWKYALQRYGDVLVDEHSYHSSEWFEKQYHRFDNYRRHSSKVYMGEYSANGLMAGKKMTVDNSNLWESALGEAVFICGMERNGDVVEMSSYAPLLNLVDSENWYANMIDFNPQTVCPSVNYYVQQLFSRNYGTTGIRVDDKLPEHVYASCSMDEQYIYLKVVNTSDKEHMLHLSGLTERKTDMVLLQNDDPNVKNRLEFHKEADIRIRPKYLSSVQGEDIRVMKKSVMALRIERN